MNNLAETIVQQHTTDSDWYKARQKGIGGSDVAAILGVSPYKTPLQVYQEKRGEIGSTPDNWRMMVGRTLEPAIRQFYSDLTGQAVHVPESIITSEKYPFMLANLDGYTEEPRVVEIKTAGSGREWGEPGSADIPTGYICQVQHYMVVTGFQVADVIVSFSNREPVIYTIEADRELQEMMIEKEAEFWQRVVDGNPPEPVTFNEAVQKYGSLFAEGTVEATKEISQVVRRLKTIREGMNAMEAEEEELKSKIILTLGDKGDTLMSGGKALATWKLAKGRNSFDSKTFEKSYPELYQQFVKTGEPSRRLLIK